MWASLSVAVVVPHVCLTSPWWFPIVIIPPFFTVLHLDRVPALPFPHIHPLKQGPGFPGREPVFLFILEISHPVNVFKFFSSLVSGLHTRFGWRREPCAVSKGGHTTGKFCGEERSDIIRYISICTAVRTYTKVEM